MNDVEKIRDVAAQLKALFELGRERNVQLTDRALAVLEDAVRLAVQAVAA